MNMIFYSLWKLQRRVYVASKALIHYIENDWLFNNCRFLDMRKQLLTQDKKDFNYSVEEIDIVGFFKSAVLGSRRYLLNEPDETIPQAQIHYKRYVCVNVYFNLINGKINKKQF